jgi:hypothetical protein
MTLPLAVTNNGMWGIALVIGLVAALIVAGLLLVLVRARRRRPCSGRSSTRPSSRTAT